MVQIDKAERSSGGGHVRWSVTFTLLRESGDDIEFTFNNITPGMIAEMRARLLLLNEQPKMRDADTVLNLGGISRSAKVGVKRGIIPELWPSYRETPQLMPAFARFWAVFHLKTPRTVDHIFSLQFGEVRNGSMTVVFKGQRTGRRTGENSIIEVTGSCSVE